MYKLDSIDEYDSLVVFAEWPRKGSGLRESKKNKRTKRGAARDGLKIFLCEKFPEGYLHHLEAYEEGVNPLSWKTGSAFGEPGVIRLHTLTPNRRRRNQMCVERGLIHLLCSKRSRSAKETVPEKVPTNAGLLAFSSHLIFYWGSFRLPRNQSLLFFHFEYIVAVPH